MRYISTRDPNQEATLSRALLDGLAPDGGLYVPAELPSLPVDEFSDLSHIKYIAQQLLAPFFDGDGLEGELDAICDETFAFDIPLRELEPQTSVLELFHGPTAAFKDVGARFLASCISRLNEGASEPVTILVATSGDTGGAVAAAFYGKPNVEVIVLYPEGRVSPRQEKQLTCWDDNVWTYAVEGDFDDCQRMVKAAFADDWWTENVRLSSANSINIGRLLPQMTYYGAASVWYWQRHRVEPGFIVPSGNLGNVLACLYAREVGLPIGDVILATNANRAVTEFLETGDWEAFETVQTLANAMDVGNPSNMERLRHLWPDVETVRDKIKAFRVGDDAIVEEIRRGPDRWGQVWDPHTACAAHVRSKLDSGDWIIVATAHPAKFNDVVEPILQREVSIPPGLAELLERPNEVENVAPTLDALREAYQSRCARE